MTAAGSGGPVDRSRHRARRLKLAVYSSLASKVSTVGLQLVAFPIAIRAVSPQQFASYSVMAGLLSFIGLCDLGLGPALTQRIAIAHANGEETKQARLLSSGLLVIVAVLGCGWVAGAGVLHLSQLTPWLAGRGISPAMVAVVAVIGSVQLLCSPFLRAQAGYQELHIYNLFGVAGNAVAALGLILVARLAPSPIAFLVAVYGTAALTQLATAAAFLVRRRHLLRGLFSPAFSLLPPLFLDGIQFAFPQVIVPIILREGPKLMLFRKGLLIETAKYGILIQIMTLASGLVVMFTQPLFPALTDAEARGDRPWIDATYRRARKGIGIFCWLFIAGALLVGPEALAVYTGKKFTFDHATLLAFSCCSALIFWNHLGLVFFQAAGRLAPFFKLSALELVLLGGFYLWRPPVDTLTAFTYVAAALAPTAVLWALAKRRGQAVPRAGLAADSLQEAAL